MNTKKYFYFGLGAGFSVILTAFLLYGIYIVYAEENLTEPPEKAGVRESFDLSMKGKAEFIDTYGRNIGMARLEESENGVLITLDVSNLPAGYHAVHIHEKGECTPLRNEDTLPPDVPETPVSYFSNAGSHLNPNNLEHGLLNPDGPHAGDLVNVNVNKDGWLKAQLFNDRVTLRAENDSGLGNLFDADGTALIIHSGTDDYETPPTGHAGSRLACAVIEKE